MTCGSKKHIEEALAKIRVDDNGTKEEKEVRSGLRRKERKKITTT